jgi:hypothetical protein
MVFIFEDFFKTKKNVNKYNKFTNLNFLRDSHASCKPSSENTNESENTKQQQFIPQRPISIAVKINASDEETTDDTVAHTKRFPSDYEDAASLDYDYNLLPPNSIESSTYTSISTCSSAYLDSCSSSNIASSRESIETPNSLHSLVYQEQAASVDETSANKNGLLNYAQAEFVSQLCAEIDSRHQDLNKNFTSLVSNTGDLKLNAKFWMYLLNEFNLISIINNDEVGGVQARNEFAKNFNKFLLCLNKLEKHLAVYLLNNNFDLSSDAQLDAKTPDYLFDSEFFLSLGFLIFEQADYLTHRLDRATIESEHGNETVFELDLAGHFDYSVCLFELNLNNILVNYVLKYLPGIVEFQKGVELGNGSTSLGSGQSVLEFFKSLFRAELSVSDRRAKECKVCAEHVDVNSFVSRPCFYSTVESQLAANPLTQSYSYYLSNLSKLSYYSYDPFSEAEKEAADYGREVNHTSTACLSLSYYSMGRAELKKSLLESSFQFLYESKQFNAEFNHLFRSESSYDEWRFTADSLKTKQLDSFDTRSNYCSNYTREKEAARKAQTQSQEPSKWNFEKQTRAENGEEEKEKKKKKAEASLLDDIINRISNLNTPALFDSYFKLIRDGDYVNELKTSETVCQDSSCSCSLSKKQQADTISRNWTVAPKLYSTNNVSNCGGLCISPTMTTTTTTSVPSAPASIGMFNAGSSLKQNLYAFDEASLAKNGYDFMENSSQSVWPKPDPRPIGTKPASMLSTSSMTGRYRNNKYALNQKCMSNSGGAKQSSPHKPAVNLVDDYKNIWLAQNEGVDEELGSFGIVSPYISFHYRNNNDMDEFFKSSENLKAKNYENTNSMIKLGAHSSSAGANLNESEVYKRSSRYSLNNMNKSSQIEAKSGKYSVAPISMINANKKKTVNNVISSSYSNELNLNAKSNFNPLMASSNMMSSSLTASSSYNCSVFKPDTTPPPQNFNPYHKRGSFDAHERRDEFTSYNNCINNGLSNQRMSSLYNSTNLPSPPKPISFPNKNSKAYTGSKSNFQASSLNSNQKYTRQNSNSFSDAKETPFEMNYAAKNQPSSSAKGYSKNYGQFDMNDENYEDSFKSRHTVAKPTVYKQGKNYDSYDSSKKGYGDVNSYNARGNSKRNEKRF